MRAVQPAVRGQRAPIDLASMHRELRRKGMTLLLLWQEYVQASAGLPTYQYTQFCQNYHAYAGTLRRSMRQVHRAGEKLFIDYAGQTVPLVDPDTGELRRAHIFIAVLGASNYTYACATPRETQVDWLRGLSQAFAFFGGVREILDDWAMTPLDQTARHDLLEVIDDRTRKSTVITSQLPIDHWHAWLNDPIVADAILDRLVHRSHRISLKGELLICAHQAITLAALRSQVRPDR